jgi:hypothetical protein
MNEDKSVQIRELEDLLGFGKAGINAYYAGVQVNNSPHFLSAYRPLAEIPEIERIDGVWGEETSRKVELFAKNLRYSFQHLVVKYGFDEETTVKFSLPFAEPQFVDVYVHLKENFLNQAVMFMGYVSPCDCCDSYKFRLFVAYMGGSQLSPNANSAAKSARRIRSMPTLDGAVKYLLRKKGFSKPDSAALHTTLGCTNMAEQFSEALKKVKKKRRRR